MSFLTDDAPKANDGFATRQTPEEKQVTDSLYDARVHETPDPGSLYSTNAMLRTTFDRNFEKLSNAGVLTLPQQAAERTEFSTLVRQTGLDLSVGILLHDQYTSARLADASDDDGADLVAQIRADSEAARTALREQFGERDAADLMQRAQKFVRQHPQLAAICQTRGIGSKVAVVQAIVEHVRAVNFQ